MKLSNQLCVIHPEKYIMKPIPTTSPDRSSRKSDPICMYFMPLIMRDGRGGGRWGSTNATRVGG